MFVHADTELHVFVLLYGGEGFESARGAARLVDILDSTGFVPAEGSWSMPVVGERPAVLELAWDGAEALLIHAGVKRLVPPATAYMLGAGAFLDQGIYGEGHYTTMRRDALVDCIQRLAVIEDFLVGFAVNLVEDFQAADYDRWFGECVRDGRLRISELLHHEYLVPSALLLGRPYAQLPGAEALQNCPAWRIGRPAPDTICIFLDEVDPGGVLRTSPSSTFGNALRYCRQVATASDL